MATSRTEAQSQEERYWITALCAAGDEREIALAELREYLLRGLRRAFPAGAGNLSMPLEDCVQEALLRITTGLSRFRGESRFTTWAMSIALRVVVSESRRLHWKDLSLDEMVQSGREELTHYKGTSGEINLARERLFNLVREIVTDGLTEKQRQAVEAELTGTPPEEVARRMNISRNALYKLTYDARVRLRKSILEAGWSEVDVRHLMERTDV